jgi:hypothetical protein
LTICPFWLSSCRRCFKLWTMDGTPVRNITKTCRHWMMDPLRSYIILTQEFQYNVLNILIILASLIGNILNLNQRFVSFFDFSSSILSSTSKNIYYYFLNTPSCWCDGCTFNNKLTTGYLTADEKNKKT